MDISWIYRNYICNTCRICISYKYFEYNNTGYIRYIYILHVSEIYLEYIRDISVKYLEYILDKSGVYLNYMLYILDISRMQLAYSWYITFKHLVNICIISKLCRRYILNRFSMYFEYIRGYILNTSGV